MRFHHRYPHTHPPQHIGFSNLVTAEGSAPTAGAAPGPVAALGAPRRWLALLTGDGLVPTPRNLQQQTFDFNHPHLQYFEKRRTESPPIVRGPGPQLEQQGAYQLRFNFVIPDPAVGGSPLRKLVSLGDDAAAFALMTSADWAGCNNIIIFSVCDGRLTAPFAGGPFPLGTVDPLQLVDARAQRCNTGVHPAGAGLRARVPLPAAGHASQPIVHSCTVGDVRAAGGAPAAVALRLRSITRVHDRGEADWKVDTSPLQGRAVRFVPSVICYPLFAAAVKLGIFYSNPIKDGAQLNCTYGDRFVVAASAGKMAMADPPLSRAQTEEVEEEETEPVDEPEEMEAVE